MLGYTELKERKNTLSFKSKDMLYYDDRNAAVICWGSWKFDIKVAVFQVFVKLKFLTFQFQWDTFYEFLNAQIETIEFQGLK